MNKLLAALLVCAVFAGAVPLARGVDAYSPPPGIASDHWIWMGKGAGFVVTAEVGDNGARQHADIVQGYFMIHRGGSWRKVDSSGAGSVHPLSMTR